MVRRLPRVQRACVNGHTWDDDALPVPSLYVPMRLRLEEARAGLQGALSALGQAETMIKDCASYLTREQQAKLSVQYELHQIGLAKAQLGEVLDMTGEKVGN
jgi:hypothetical protein